jgi:hypothetical protein
VWSVRGLLRWLRLREEGVRAAGGVVVLRGLRRTRTISFRLACERIIRRGLLRSIGGIDWRATRLSIRRLRAPRHIITMRPVARSLWALLARLLLPSSSTRTGVRCPRTTSPTPSAPATVVRLLFAAAAAGRRSSHSLWISRLPLPEDCPTPLWAFTLAEFRAAVTFIIAVMTWLPPLLPPCQSSLADVFSSSPRSFPMVFLFFFALVGRADYVVSSGGVSFFSSLFLAVPSPSVCVTLLVLSNEGYDFRKKEKKEGKPG